MHSHSKEIYKTLCEQFDKVLLSKRSNEFIIANPYLHFIKLHPNFLRKYTNKSLFNFSLGFFISLLKIIIRTFQSIFDRKHFYHLNELKKCDLLIVSHLDSLKQIGEDQDIHFGNIPKILQKQDIKCCLVLINNIGLKNPKKITPWKNSPFQRVVLSKTMSVISEMKLIKGFFASIPILKELINSTSLERGLKKNVFTEMHSTINELRIANQVNEIIDIVKPKAVISPYEGHPYERLIFFFIRKRGLPIKCFSYQHSIIFEHQHPIRRNLGELYDPEIIFSSGINSLIELEKSNNLKNTMKFCIGSKKFIEPSNYEQKKKNICLVIPEGFLSECYILFELSLEFANKHPNQRFIWRLHPSQSFDNLIKNYPKFRKIPTNISFSNQTIEEDMRKCNSFLYRGSTAAITAISFGLKAIYYKLPKEDFLIDPIYMMAEDRHLISDLKQLEVALSEEQSIDSITRLQNLSKDIYSKLDVRELTSRING